MALSLSVPRPRLLVRTITGEDGRPIPLLADSSGTPLPMQREVSLSYDHLGRAEVTVRFAVAGELVQLVPDKMEGAA